jgi:hypothetical protein
MRRNDAVTAIASMNSCGAEMSGITIIPTCYALHKSDQSQAPDSNRFACEVLNYPERTTPRAIGNSWTKLIRGSVEFRIASCKHDGPLVLRDVRGERLNPGLTCCRNIKVCEVYSRRT